MNSDSLEKEIARFKARKNKARLASYCTIITIFLCLSPFSAGFSLSGLIAVFIILPLPLYFFLQTLKLSKRIARLKLHVADLVSTIPAPVSQFSLAKFLTQPNFAFRLSLVLFLLICFTTLARTRTPDPELTLNPAPLAINR